MYMNNCVRIWLFKNYFKKGTLEDFDTSTPFEVHT